MMVLYISFGIGILLCIILLCLCMRVRITYKEPMDPWYENFNIPMDKWIEQVKNDVRIVDITDQSELKQWEKEHNIRHWIIKLDRYNIRIRQLNECNVYVQLDYNDKNYKHKAKMINKWIEEKIDNNGDYPYRFSIEKPYCRLHFDKEWNRLWDEYSGTLNNTISFTTHNKNKSSLHNNVKSFYTGLLVGKAF